MSSCRPTSHHGSKPYAIYSVLDTGRLVKSVLLVVLVTVYGPDID